MPGDREREASRAAGRSLDADGRARAALALYLGAGAMRKAGAPVTDVDALRSEACRLLGVD